MDNNLEVTVLGAGGAVASMAQGNSSFLVKYRGLNILVDCGPTVPFVLRDEGIGGVRMEDIDHVFITHTHGDHINGLEMLIVHRFYIHGKKTNIVCSGDVAYHVVTRLRDLAFRAGGDERAYHNGDWWEEFLTFDSPDIPWCHYPVKHISTMRANAFRIGFLAISGDTNCPVQEPNFWEGAKLIFHDVSSKEDGCHCFFDHLEEALSPTGFARPLLPKGAKVFAYHGFGLDALVENSPSFEGVLRKGMTFTLREDE